MPTKIIEELESFLSTKPSRQELDSWLARLSPEDHVLCVLHMMKDEPPMFTRVLKPELAFIQPEKLTDEELFAQLAKAMDDTMEIRSGKIALIDPKEKPEPISRFASLYNEAIRRGFTRQDIGFAMRPYLEQSEKLGGIPSDPTWKRFEMLVARIHLSLCRDAEVHWSESIVDRTGRKRQVDVTVRQKMGPYGTLTVIECKNERKPVPIEDVESFATKKQDLRADLAIMVSSSGYQAGALEKAKFHGITLYTLEEAEKVSWQEETRTFRVYYHMFDSLEFHPPAPPTIIEKATVVKLERVVIRTRGKQLSLSNVSASAVQNATDCCLPLPCVLEIPFESGSTIELKGRVLPLEKISFKFTHKVGVERTKHMRVPTGATYKFASAEGTPVCKIREIDLPTLEDS